MKKIFFASLVLSASLFAADNDLVMATTTSTDNTGLLDAIYLAYKAETGVDILSAASRIPFLRPIRGGVPPSSQQQLWRLWRHR